MGLLGVTSWCMIQCLVDLRVPDLQYNLNFFKLLLKKSFFFNYKLIVCKFEKLKNVYACKPRSLGFI